MSGNLLSKLVNFILLIWDAPLNFIALLLLNKVKYTSTRSVLNHYYNINFIEFKFIDSITIGSFIFMNYKYIGKEIAKVILQSEVIDYKLSRYLGILYIPRLIWRLCRR